MSTQNIAAPRSPQTTTRTRGRVNLEAVGWVFMRVSGVALVVLLFGHLFFNLMLGDGISAIDWAFVAGKLANPIWIVWDVLLLWLALIHGANGMRTLINDYAHGRFRTVLLWSLFTTTVVLLVLGTLVLTTFDPCLAPTENADLIALCAAQE